LSHLFTEIVHQNAGEEIAQQNAGEEITHQNAEEEEIFRDYFTEIAHHQ
jgi:hypothetical protein